MISLGLQKRTNVDQTNKVHYVIIACTTSIIQGGGQADGEI